MPLSKDEKRLLLELNETGSMRLNTVKDLRDSLLEKDLIVECCFSGKDSHFVISKSAFNILKEIIAEKKEFRGDFSTKYDRRETDERTCLYARELCVNNKSKIEIEIDKFYEGYDKQWKRYMEATDESELNRIWNILEKQLDKFMR